MADDRVARRAAELHPEERTSEDPDAQAEQILAESDQRQEDRNAAPTSYVEHRTSDETTPPV